LELLVVAASNLELVVENERQVHRYLCFNSDKSWVLIGQQVSANQMPGFGSVDKGTVGSGQRRNGGTKRRGRLS